MKAIYKAYILVYQVDMIYQQSGVYIYPQTDDQESNHLSGTQLLAVVNDKKDRNLLATVTVVDEYRPTA